MADRDLLQYVDDPDTEDRWSDARSVADRAGRPRHGFAGALAALRQEGLVESMETGRGRKLYTATLVWRRVL